MLHAEQNFRPISIPLYRTKYKKYFITTRSVPIWRDLPNKLRSIKNKKYFMKKLKKYLLDQ